MKNLVATTKIMRSKVFKFVKLHLWLTFKPIYYSKFKTLDLMIALVANRFFRRSKA